jgi:hypothetical protein
MASALEDELIYCVLVLLTKFRTSYYGPYD